MTREEMKKYKAESRRCALERDIHDCLDILKHPYMIYNWITRDSAKRVVKTLALRGHRGPTARLGHYYVMEEKTSHFAAVFITRDSAFLAVWGADQKTCLSIHDRLESLFKLEKPDVQNPHVAGCEP